MVGKQKKDRNKINIQYNKMRQVTLQKKGGHFFLFVKVKTKKSGPPKLINRLIKLKTMPIIFSIGLFFVIIIKLNLFIYIVKANGTRIILFHLWFQFGSGLTIRLKSLTLKNPSTVKGYVKGTLYNRGVFHNEGVFHDKRGLIFVLNNIIFTSGLQN